MALVWSQGELNPSIRALTTNSSHEVAPQTPRLNYIIFQKNKKALGDKASDL